MLEAGGLAGSCYGQEVLQHQERPSGLATQGWRHAVSVSRFDLLRTTVVLGQVEFSLEPTP